MKTKQLILTAISILTFGTCFCQVIFKNTGGNKVYVAIGYHESKKGWTTKGWFQIGPNEEKEVYSPTPFGPSTFYYCATIEKCDKGYFGDKSLYVNRQDAFTIDNAENDANYPNPEIVKYNFIKTQLNTLDSNIIEIKPENLTCYEKKQGKWKFGLDKEGNFAEIQEDIRSYREINFDQDKPIGWCKDYYPDGKTKAEYKLLSFVPFQYDGKCTWYKSDGTIDREITYRDGIALSETTTKSGGGTSTKNAHYEIVKLPLQQVYLNSTSNEFWKGGNSKSIIPVNLPEGTVEWYYEFSCSRDSAEIKNNEAKFQLAAQLTKLADDSGLLKATVETFTAPPGSNYCDIYLIENLYYNDFLNEGNFKHYTVGSRQNYKSGIVQVRNLKLDEPRIAIKNKDMSYGIHVSVQVVAIVARM